MEEGVLEAIGKTPLVRLHRLLGSETVRCYAKLEALNPGGSAKDRPALAMIQRAMADGLVKPSTVIIESSSGNMGIGLAQVCGYYGLRFICVVDIKTTQQNLNILRLYGAEIEMVTEPDPETNELLQARLKRVEQLQQEYPDSFWPNQYANRENSASHLRTTMREICETLGGGPDYLLCATSTCGTIRGCTEYVQEHGLSTEVIAVDALGSRIFDSPPAPRHVPGLGAGLRPPLCPFEDIRRCIHVSVADCVLGCRLLLTREAIFAGGSSGGVAVAALRLRAEMPAGASCVMILPDRGERYVDTMFDDGWVREHVGDVEPQWQELLAL